MFILNDQHQYFESSLLKDLGVISGFGTKKTPPIEEIIEANNYISMLQVHSATIEVIKNAPQEKMTRIDNLDGMITDLSDVVLLLKTADCVPAVYFDPVAQITAVTHQGWRGTIANMAKVAVEKLVSCGCQVDNIRVALGPSLQDCCNRLYDQRYEDFKSTYTKWFDDFTQIDGDNTYISLPRLNALQYQAEGIKEEHIDMDIHCTRCETDMFFSYDRKDYDISDIRTRNWSFIMK
ncbi:polyphenol oxidase family protein [Candidatus Woesebacteria bacterium]|nr:polyphenol oxidase family protein [Candidatus Woesebacteria bacterium]